MASRIALLVSHAAFSMALLLASPTRADGVADEAELQFQIGTDAYRKGDFRGALEHFLASNRLVPNRNVMFNIARAYEQLSRFPDAYRYYTDSMRGEIDPAIKRDVEAAIARIAPRVAVIEIASTPPGATVYLNRKDLGSVAITPARLGLPAGTYSVILELAGHEATQLGPLNVQIGTRTPVTAGLRLIVGTIKIAGVPGTEIRLDDEAAPAACVTPCQLDVAPGPHLLFFSLAGFRATPRSVNVVARETVKVTAELTAQTGSILVSTDEPEATIEIDGKRVGFAPTVVAGVPVGRRTVRVSLRGYEPIERVVDVQADQQVDLVDLSLEPLRQVSAASRETQRIDDAPASVTIVEAQEIEAFGYPTILEAVRGVRGFATTYDSFYGSAAIRGLGQSNDYNNRLLVLSDGAVLNENIAYQPLIHYDGRVDLGDVDRIEIVRGPASVLYGTGAVSGVINLVLRGRDTPTGVHARVSTNDDTTTRVRLDAALARGEDAGAWGSVALAHSGGREVVLNFDDGSGTVGPQRAQGFDKFDGLTLAAKAWWKGLTLQSFYTQRSLIVPTGPFGATFNDPRNTEGDRRFLTEVKYEAELSSWADLTLRGYVNGSSYRDRGVYLGVDDMTGAEVEIGYRDDYEGRWLGAEARLALRLGDRLKLAIGAEGTVHPRVEIKAGETAPDGAFTPVLDVDAPYQVAAGYALLDWKPGPRFALQAGARFDYWNLGGNLEAGAGDPDVITSFAALSPRLALIAKPSDRDVIKLMGGTAFRAPSAYEYYYDDNEVAQVISSVCGKDLEPETVLSLELEGSRHLGRDWIGLIAAHAAYARNIVETAPVPMEARCGNAAGERDGLQYYRNSPIAQVMIGADVEIRREWRAGTMLSAQYGYLRARYTDDPDPSNDDRALPNAPTHYASFKAVAPIVRNLATGAIRVSLEDRRRIDTASTDRSARAVIADAVVSGSVGRSGARYAVGVYNLFNWQLELPAFTYSSRLIPQSGRSFMLSIGYSR